jgi:branched-subunit amino acid transport protein
MTPGEAIVTILGLAVVTLLSRGLFVISARRTPIPPWLLRGLKVAPLAALAAIIVPEVVLTQGALIRDWQDARWPAVLAATAWYVWRPGVLGPMLAGLAVFLPLRLAFGW